MYTLRPTTALTRQSNNSTYAGLDWILLIPMMLRKRNSRLVTASILSVVISEKSRVLEVIVHGQHDVTEISRHHLTVEICFNCFDHIVPMVFQFLMDSFLGTLPPTFHIRFLNFHFFCHESADRITVVAEVKITIQICKLWLGKDVLFYTLLKQPIFPHICQLSVATPS